MLCIDSKLAVFPASCFGLQVMFRAEMDPGSYYGGNYFAAADKAASTLSELEEEDLIRLACQASLTRTGRDGPPVCCPLACRKLPSDCEVALSTQPTLSLRGGSL